MGFTSHRVNLEPSSMKANPHLKRIRTHGQQTSKEAYLPLCNHDFHTIIPATAKSWVPDWPTRPATVPQAYQPLQSHDPQTGPQDPQQSHKHTCHCKAISPRLAHKARNCPTNIPATVQPWLPLLFTCFLSNKSVFLFVRLSSPLCQISHQLM